MYDPNPMDERDREKQSDGEGEGKEELASNVGSAPAHQGVARIEEGFWATRATVAFALLAALLTGGLLEQRYRATGYDLGRFEVTINVAYLLMLALLGAAVYFLAIQSIITRRIRSLGFVAFTTHAMAGVLGAMCFGLALLVPPTFLGAWWVVHYDATHPTAGPPSGSHVQMPPQVPRPTISHWAHVTGHWIWLFFEFAFVALIAFAVLGSVLGFVWSAYSENRRKYKAFLESQQGDPELGPRARKRLKDWRNREASYQRMYEHALLGRDALGRWVRAVLQSARRKARGWWRRRRKVWRPKSDPAPVSPASSAARTKHPGPAQRPGRAPPRGSE